jgi:hypothetical protein
MQMATMTETGKQLAMPTGPGTVPLRPPARSDSLPEYTRYRDDGCDIHPHCLTCPLPRCRYEEPGGLRALLNEYRDRQIVELRRKGMAVDELAGRFGVSRRTVFRVLGNSRHAEPSENGAPIPIRKRPAERKAYCA